MEERFLLGWVRDAYRPWQCPFRAAKAASISLGCAGPAVYTLYLTLPELPAGDIQLHYVTEAMLPRLEVREHLFAEARAALANYDPAQEFLVLVWLPASMFFYRRKRIDVGTA